MPSRRQFLGIAAAGLCAALAGCADPAGVLQMSLATTDVIVGNAARSIDSAPDEVRELLDDVLESGTATIEDRRPPLDGDRPVAYGGRVYELSMTEAGERTRTEYEIELDFDPVDADGTVRALEDLPSADADRLAPMLERYRRSENEGYDVGTREYYDDDELEESVLVPEQEVDIVSVDGEPVRVRTRPQETTVTTFEYEVVDDLGSEESYADELREAYRFELTGLDDDERAVIEEAIDEGGYYASSTSDDAFEGAARALLEHEPVTNDEYEGGWIADYDGSTYWARLDLLQYRELREELPSR